MSETRATRLPRANPDTGPIWARATRTFYADSFDIRSKKAFVEAMQDFVELSPAEQAFHQAHLTFRQVQALEDVHATLGRIETALVGLEAKVDALKHLAPIRKALQDLTDGQADLLDLMEDDLGEPEEAEIVDEIPDDVLQVEPDAPTPVVPEVIVPEEKPRRAPLGPDEWPEEAR